MARNHMRFCVELTNHCNFGCVYCPHSLYGEEDTPGGSVFDRRKGFMDPALFRKTVAEAERWAGIYSVGFFGEQQLHSRFDELVLGVPEQKDRKFMLTLNTNFSLVTYETVETLRRFDQVRISLDASTKKLWEALCPRGDVLDKDGVRGVGRYETLVEKIRWFLGLRDRPRVLLVYVRQTANRRDEAAFRSEWGRRLRPGDALIMKAVLTFGGVMIDPSMQRRGCKVAGENRFAVAWDGRCTPCTLDVNIAMEAGDLRVQSVGEIVESSQWAARLRDIRDRAGICANCFDGQNYGIRTDSGT